MWMDEIIIEAIHAGVWNRMDSIWCEHFSDMDGARLYRKRGGN